MRAWSTLCSSPKYTDCQALTIFGLRHAEFVEEGGPTQSNRSVVPSSGTRRPLTADTGVVYTESRYRMPIQKSDIDNRCEYRDLHAGLIRLHILHHAVEGSIFGLEMAQELARHGYRISLGTLYPLLHGLEKKGYLRSVEKRKGQSIRKIYRATPFGRKALEAMKSKVSELFGELNETR
jgi:PadR family transcriptional regulator PadR